MRVNMCICVRVCVHVYVCVCMCAALSSTAISSGFIDSRLRERFEPSLLEFGKNAVVSCRFRSKFPGLHAYWENLTIPGAQVYNYTVPGSSKFGIDVFRPEHEGKVTCVGSVAQGTATRTFTLKGLRICPCLTVFIRRGRLIKGVASL